MKRYYNTTGLNGVQLEAFERAATRQDDAILSLYRKIPEMSPSTCWRLLETRGITYPLTSVRRSINTLTKLGSLHKTELMITGHYGKPEHVWRYNVHAECN